MNADILLTLPELARVVRTSRSRVWCWVKTGCKIVGTNRRLLLPVQRVGGRWKVAIADYEMWKTQLAGQSPPATSARLKAYAADLEAFRAACRRS